MGHTLLLCVACAEPVLCYLGQIALALDLATVGTRHRVIELVIELSVDLYHCRLRKVGRCHAQGVDRFFFSIGV